MTDLRQRLRAVRHSFKTTAHNRMKTGKPCWCSSSVKPDKDHSPQCSGARRALDDFDPDALADVVEAAHRALSRASLVDSRDRAMHQLREALAKLDGPGELNETL